MGSVLVYSPEEGVTVSAQALRRLLEKGDGDAAALLDRKPADLTTISARNGGVFPGTAVMAKIWGYTGGRDGASPMPGFGPLLQGQLVPYDGGDGIQTPTPVRLVQLAEYLKAIQE